LESIKNGNKILNIEWQEKKVRLIDLNYSKQVLQNLKEIMNLKESKASR
jgi:hypothetical protein